MNYKKRKQEKKKILIFDSGIGGFSIYYAIKKILPNFNYIYFFDNDCFPYGEKEETFIIKRTIKIIKKIQKKQNLLMTIIACNTVSVLSLQILKKKFIFPIIGVLPAIKEATKISKNKIIGLLGTKITIHAKYTKKLIQKFINKYKIITIYSKELVYLAEQKFIQKKISTKEIKNILKPYSKLKKKPDTIILGCTHYYFLLKEIKENFTKKTKIIDTRSLVAKKAFYILKKKHTNLLQKNENIAYCTNIKKNTKELKKKIKKTGFLKLKEILIKK